MVMPSPPRLLSFEFSSLCLIAFLAIANGTAYYNLFGHLAALGIPAELRGLVVGAYSLVAMALYLVASPFLTVRNAPRAMLVGIAVLVVGGLSFLVVRSFWGLLLLRSFCGAGGFLLGAGATSLLVGVIPPDRSGEAFGIYSVAILAAYGIVPAGMDLLVPHLPSVAAAYALAGLVLLPASGLVVALRRRIQSRAPPPGEEHHPPSRSDLRAAPRDRRLLLVLAIGVTYFTNWSSLYYLFKGFATERGLANVGAFFSALTAVMIGIRLVAGRLFDRFDKARLAALSFGMIALGHLALATLPIGMAPVIGAFFGLGLGAGYPALNGLMFEMSEPRFRPRNANRMMFGVQLGSFLGPSVGGALVARFGYGGYFRGSILLALASAGLSLLLVRTSSRE
jgi:MFS family permease